MASFIINNDGMLKKKIELVESLIDIKTAFKVSTTLAKKSVAKKDSKSKLLPNPVDEDFAKLNCKMELLSKSDKEYKMIEDYIAKGS